MKGNVEVFNKWLKWTALQTNLETKSQNPNPTLLCTLFCQVTHENLMGSVEQHYKHPSSSPFFPFAREAIYRPKTAELLEDSLAA